MSTNHATIAPTLQWVSLLKKTRAERSEKILKVLSLAHVPMDVENIRVLAGLKNWESTKATLLEMVMDGLVLGQKTTKSWIFWVNPPAEKESS